MLTFGANSSDRSPLVPILTIRLLAKTIRLKGPNLLPSRVTVVKQVIMDYLMFKIYHIEYYTMLIKTVIASINMKIFRN